MPRKPRLCTMNTIYLSLGALLILTSLANVFTNYFPRRDHKALNTYCELSHPSCRPVANSSHSLRRGRLPRLLSRQPTSCLSDPREHSPLPDLHERCRCRVGVRVSARRWIPP